MGAKDTHGGKGKIFFWYKKCEKTSEIVFGGRKGKEGFDGTYVVVLESMPDHGHQGRGKLLTGRIRPCRSCSLILCS
jgi:hypothetical protein